MRNRQFRKFKPGPLAILEKFQFAALAKCFRHAKYANFSNLMSLA